MRKSTFYFLSIFIAFGLFSCSKSTTTTTTKACADCEGILANAGLDSSQKGVYKGIAVSGEGIGHFKFFYENGNSNTYLILKFTRNKYPVLNDSLTPTTSITFNPNSITQFTLLGSVAKNTASLATPPAYSSLSDFTLSGGIGTGAKPQTSMMKETTNGEVKIYEGTMTLNSSTGEAGKIGFVVKGNKITGIIANSMNSLRESFYDGTIGSDNKFSFSFSGNNSTYAGSLSADGKDINGTITMGGSSYGAFTATRAF